MEILAEVTRGQLTESIHRGSIAVVDEIGNILSHIGNPEIVTYYRSASKPIQALPIITLRAVNKFKLTDKEIAILCASHSGEEKHITILEGLLKKLNLSKDMLQCGIHPPLHTPSAIKLWNNSVEPDVLHNNCSGKHLGMLIMCKYYGWSIDNYLSPEHPLQQMLLRVMKEFHNYEDVKMGIDGCGVPVYALPLKEIAKGYAILSNFKKITECMTKYPELIAGTDRIETIMMETLGHKIIAKTGAEGILCIGLVGKGIGISIKVEDGSERALGCIGIEVLKQLGFLTKEELVQLGSKHKVSIKNHRSEIVGEIRPIFTLNKGVTCYL